MAISITTFSGMVRFAVAVPACLFNKLAKVFSFDLRLDGVCIMCV